MQHISMKTVAAAGITILVALFAVRPLAQAQAGHQRKILLQQDLAIPGHQILLVAVTLAVDGREGRHTHSGTLVGHVLEGELTFEVEGQPTRKIKAGESVLVEPGHVHEGINRGSVPIKALVVFIVEKGKPLTTQVP
jgi:quercetin dioxygenase-like cupin family protein